MNYLIILRKTLLEMNVRNEYFRIFFSEIHILIIIINYNRAYNHVLGNDNDSDSRTLNLNS